MHIYKKKNEKGFMLVTVLLILVVLVIFVQVITFLMQHESKWAVSHKKKTIAIQLAEAGADRGIWKLNESTAVWDDLESGPIAGYNNDVTYTDVDGGTYKVQITAPSEDERKVVATGRDASGSVVRKIEIIMVKAMLTSSVTAPSIVFTGSAETHWGPMTSLSTMNLTGSAVKDYPIKYARGGISPWDTNPAPPNSDTGYGSHNYKAYYNVPTPPDPDLGYYFANKNVYETSFREFKNMTDTTDKIYYCTDDVKLKNSFLCGTLIVLGNLILSGNGSGSYDADIPEEAWKQYEAIDTVATGEYPGDAGYQAVDATYAITQVAFKGYIYVGGNLTSSGTPAINGVIQVKGTTSGVGNLTLYYNEDIGMEAKTASTDITRTSWKELAGEW